jgi:hypothetical protein
MEGKENMLMGITINTPRSKPTPPLSTAYTKKVYGKVIRSSGVIHLN